ncbi:MAG TPA: hypothetical protein DD473_13230 [Planctomycetaceae bacterium]|nr:hypothetical protein [Planctomycetaceae bacterium]
MLNSLLRFNDHSVWHNSLKLPNTTYWIIRQTKCLSKVSIERNTGCAQNQRALVCGIGQGKYIEKAFSEKDNRII